MTHKKKTKAVAKATPRRKPHHTGRRMGAVHGTITEDLEEAAGIVIGSMLATAAQRNITAIGPKPMAIAQIVGGFMLKRNMSDKAIPKGIGYGLIAAGSVHLAHDLGVIHGLDDLVSGYNLNYGGGSPAVGEAMDYVQLPAQRVNGITNRAFVSGLDNQDMVTTAMPTVADMWHAEGMTKG
jgi:hypothetical protein